MRHVWSARCSKASVSRVNEINVGNGRQTESLFLAPMNRGKMDQKTGGSKPWESMLILT